MTNEEAMKQIKVIKVFMGYDKDNPIVQKAQEALDMAIEALEQEPCEDCVSREAVENAIKHAEVNFTVNSAIDFTKHKREVHEIVDGIVDAQIKALRALPSVTPQPKMGRWIYTPKRRLDDETDEGRVYITDYRCTCSECGGDFGFRKMSDAYCKYCGARMEVSE